MLWIAFFFGGGGGGGGGGYSPSGPIPQMPVQFATWITQNIPIQVFIANGGVLPPGFTPELAEQLKEFCQQNNISQKDYYHLVANPNLAPILNKFCEEFPSDENTVGNNNQTPIGPNDPQPPIGEGQYCDVLKKIVFDCALNADQAEWLGENEELFTPISFLLNNNQTPVVREMIVSATTFSFNLQQAQWLLGNTDNISQFYNLVQNNNIQYAQSKVEAAQLHLQLLMSDPEYFTLNQEMAIWPTWMWELVAGAFQIVA